MSSNNYNSYNYPYHNHQSSAQQYSSYQTAPALNTNAQSSRQYQQPHSATSNQSADYLSYSAPSYGTANSGYGNAADANWGGSSSTYGTTRDNGSHAAEVLRNMSNTGYSSATTSPSQPGFTATSTASAQYSGHSPQVQAQPPHTSNIAYGHGQARPRSVNAKQAQASASASRERSEPATAAGYPPQRALPQYQQRTTSPTQPQSGHYNATTASRDSAIAAAGTSQQYHDFSRRQLPDVDISRTSHSAATSYTARPPAPVDQPPPSSIPEPYTGSSTTVDPTAVYDPWPEYQRQQAIRDAARAEQERKDDEARKEKEQTEDEERMRNEVEGEARQAQIAASQPKPQPKKVLKQQMPASGAAAAMSTAETEAPAGSELESEIRAMMAKMRELNGKDPQLLARIWEEERRAKGPKSPTATTRPALQPALVPPIQVPTPPIANQRKKATPRESSVKPPTPVQAQAIPARPQATVATPVRTGGSTIWPPEKKLELAKAAARYLTTKNPDRPLEADQIFQTLNGNPSYVELCEQLEQMGYKLDRSIFAKSLLMAVPDVNSASRKTALQPVPPGSALKALAPPAVMKHPAPPAVMKHAVSIPGAAPSPRYTPAAASPMYRSPYSTFPDDNVLAAASPRPVAEMIPIKPELKPPANKEEAARKRNLSDLIDLTQLDEDDDMGPPMKRPNTGPMYTYTTPYPPNDSAMDVDAAPINNFPTVSMPAPQQVAPAPRVVPMPANELRLRAVVEPLDNKKALRRNTYNPATIARDILLACGRHPFERQLNQHLDILKVNLPQISNESDLSTIKWDMIDPGRPPPGYFKDGVQALTEDADDEDVSEDEDQDGGARQRSGSHATGGESARVQALPEATNPFIKQKRCGRPPRHSLPNTTTPATPNRQTDPLNMSASVPRPADAAAGVGYSAFRSATEYGPDGKPLPKKKGRPVGWRKAIHGSSAAQSRPDMNGQTLKSDTQQSNGLRNVNSGGGEPISIDSRSPSVVNRIQHQSFKCKWQGCTANLHNLDTLKKHVFKTHSKHSPHNNFECLWDSCSKEAVSSDATTNTRLEFGAEHLWHNHMQQNHFDPLAWEQGDGPTGGVSGTED